MHQNEALRGALFDSERRNEQLATTLQFALAQIAVMERKLHGVLEDAAQDCVDGEGRGLGANDTHKQQDTTRRVYSDSDSLFSSTDTSDSYALHMFPPDAAAVQHNGETAARTAAVDSRTRRRW